MKKNLLARLMLLTLLVNVFLTYGQSNDPILISENKETFINSIINQKSDATTRIKISKNEFLDLKLNLKNQNGDNLSLIGIVNNDRLSTFSLEKTNNQLTGELLLKGSKKAYKFSTDNQGKVFLTETDIHDVLCVDFESLVVDEKKTTGASVKMNLQLESLPGAEGIIYLDFDGEVVTGTRWVGGDTINAEAANFTDQQIIEIWKLMAEDFRPFNLNVTTRRDLFDASPINRRMMVIFTPTKDASPDAGGVAYLRSFSSNTFDDPCWVYNIRSVRAAGETGSHEVGHTLGLSHDGQGGTEYYRGHGTWSPIMGWSVNRQIGHWSLGEYENATQNQDDIAIMADNRNGVGFRNDDHADIITEATLIQVTTDGAVNADQNFGFIGQRTDKDVFSFVMETGDVSFNFEPDPNYPNLNIQARILDALGEQVAFSDPSGLSASISTNLPGGTYFIEIDGVGEGNTFEGYSDYSSLGSYYISGNYIPGDNNQPPVANFEGTKMGCSLVEFKNLSINRVNSYLWDFGDGNTSNEQNPSHTYETAGNYTVTLTVTNDVGANTNEKNNFIEINIPDVPTGDDQNICPGESVTLSVSGNSDFTWYSEATGGIALGFGAEFNTPELDATQTYYVGGSIGQCNTETRTEIRAVVVPLPESPTISVNEAQRLSVPAQYTNYQWYLDGEAQESSDQAEYLPQQIGEYTVEVFNEAGCSVVSAAFTVDRSQLNLSLDNREFSFFPNPLKADQLFNIEGITANDFDLRIVDVLGQIVYQSEPNAILDLNDLTSGLYFILINNESIGKFVKQ
ncbi:PKD domain-containing protein [Aquimarina spongiae]|uniref:Por secretion system C-terminal sorting domain-containing protein n=1 Tax=Aquimarina spongiae TaxID=570521 RepID=A0A1M6BJF4_9FLAO|nr:PKD domain-containing protein [Aquimarina spongiae]SHI48826.1 Por secretion system C-terminal sorting domain-containing protein [Aquimarina spongiae]